MREEWRAVRVGGRLGELSAVRSRARRGAVARTASMFVAALVCVAVDARAAKPTRPAKPAAAEPPSSSSESAPAGKPNPSPDSAPSDKSDAAPSAAPPHGESPPSSVPVEPAPSSQPAGPAPSAAAPESAAPAVREDAVPDPLTWRQEPSSYLRKARPVTPDRTVEVGFGAGVTSRPATSGNVTYGLARTYGAHLRVDLWKWLAARVEARWETVAVNFSEGALSMPPGTTYTEPDLDRVYLGASLEPTLYPTARLALWGGAGIGWGRTTAQSLYTHGAEQVTLPIRSSVFVEVPLSAGVRYEVIENWLVVNLSGKVGFLSDQSGNLENPYDTPGKSGRIVTAGGFPELGTSFGVLAGVGCIL